MVEISLNESLGKIKVHKVWMAIDGGLIVQPDAARANLESGINYGISSILHERLTVRQGAVQQSNYHNYQVMRMSDVPEEIHILIFLYIKDENLLCPRTFFAMLKRNIFQ